MAKMVIINNPKISLIWIQNFGLKQNINFSVGKALPTLGLDTPFKDLFSNKSILIFSHNAYDIDTTKSFCQKIENEIDIIGLQLNHSVKPKNKS